MHRDSAAPGVLDAGVLRNLDENELTMGEQLHVIWAKKWRILALTILGAGIAGILAFIVRPRYQATALIMPVTQSSSEGGLGQLGAGSALGGIAALAGLRMGGEGKEEALAVLQSRALTDLYIAQNNLLPILLKGVKGAPTLWKANQLFKKSVRQVTSDSKTGMVSVSITWTNPVLAAAWANGLVTMTNDYMRNKAIREAERNIDYLNQQAAKTNVVEVKEGIYSLLLREINREMLARGSQEYALKVIDPAVPPEKPSSPHKLLWIFVGGVLGLFASLGMVIIAADKRRAVSRRGVS